MAYQALARKWRPQSFGDILGQRTTVQTLQNSIEQKRIHHAYLFSGVRGVGKTSLARILAKTLNCEKGPAAEPCNVCTICREITEGIDLDVREIDAATYSKAEDVREIREVLQFQPARDRYRIFIIDEVHSLSGQAWNALLKQIEEPPPHVIFMMATTEMQKVPATILSRVQQFPLRKITADELHKRLEEICRSEGIDADREALDIVVRRGEGSVRDSLSILDQIIAFGGRSLRGTDVAAILGLSPAIFFGELMKAIDAGDPARVLELLDEAAEAGRDFKVLFRDFLGYLRNLLLIAGGAPEKLFDIPPAEIEALRATASTFSYAEILRILNALLRDDDLINRSEQQRLAVEVAILKVATLPRLRSVEDALAGTPGAAGGTAPDRGRVAATRPKPAPVGGREAAPPPPPSGDAATRLLPAIAQQRTATAMYLESAKIRLEGGTLVIEFEPEQQFAADNASDSAPFIAECAAAVFGEPVKVSVRVRTAAPPEEQVASPRRSTIQDDPVVRSFQKHLGGEVVSRGSSTRRTDEH